LPTTHQTSERNPNLGHLRPPPPLATKSRRNPLPLPATSKLRETKHIKLYCSSPAGCRNHANQRLPTAVEAFGLTYGISADGSASNSLTFKLVSAPAHPKKITPDEDPTGEQLCDAKACYLSHVMEASWDKTHMEAHVVFFIRPRQSLIQQHPRRKASPSLVPGPRVRGVARKATHNRKLQLSHPKWNSSGRLQSKQLTGPHQTMSLRSVTILFTPHAIS
jgi:hypothetical protein